MGSDCETYRHPSLISARALLFGPVSFLQSDAHRDKRGDHGEIADAINQKTITFANSRNDQASDGWANQSRCVHHGRVESDRVRQVLAMVHHFDQERLPCRHVQGVYYALQQHESNDLPHVYGARECKDSQQEGLDHRYYLGHNQRAVPVPAINPNARDRSKQK